MGDVVKFPAKGTTFKVVNTCIYDLAAINATEAQRLFENMTIEEILSLPLADENFELLVSNVHPDPADNAA